MTNSLPAGTRNTSLNLIDEEYDLVTGTTGQAGAFYKEWALIGLKLAGKAGDELAAFMAANMERIRDERLLLKHGITKTLLAFLLSCLVAQFILGESEAARRIVRRSRRDGIAAHCEEVEG